jgi:hypothetical protein
MRIEFSRSGQPIELSVFHQQFMRAQEEQSDVRNIVRNIVF